MATFPNRIIVKQAVSSIMPQRNIGIGIDFSQPSIFQVVNTTPSQVKNDIINYVLTNNGERFYNYTFGGNIVARLFDTLTDVSSISDALQTGILNNVPNITNVNVVVAPSNADRNTFLITISYSVYGITDQFTIQV